MTRSNKLNTNARTTEELFGSDYNVEMKYHYSEKEYPNEIMAEIYGETDEKWNHICGSTCYAIIRICGRKAQLNAEDRTFLLDDVFRIYGYGNNGKTKYIYNRDAHLWVFYIGVDIPGESDHHIWVQTPLCNRARKFRLKDLSKTSGLVIDSVKRDKTAYDLYVKDVKNELKSLTTLFYSNFKNTFVEAKNRLITEDTGRPEDLPANSIAEWNYGGLMYL